MNETDKIVAAILAAALCTKAGAVEMDDYIANYEEIARRLSERPVKQFDVSDEGEPSAGGKSP
jgi:hypothetical protein